jgi:hypothetical protein
MEITGEFLFYGYYPLFGFILNTEFRKVNYFSRQRV